MPTEPRYGTARSRRPRPYAWVPLIIVLLTVVALGGGAVTLHYMKGRLIALTGESLALMAAQIADKTDHLLIEREGDALMMANAFAGRTRDVGFMTDYLGWMKANYPVYLWLGVLDTKGRIVAASDPATLGIEVGDQPWLRAMRDVRGVHIGDVAPYELAGGVDAVAFVAPIRGADGTWEGVVATRVHIPSVENVIAGTLQAFALGGGVLERMEYQVLNADGLAFIDSDLLHKGRVNLKEMGLPSVRESRSGMPGYLEERHLRRNVPVLTGYAKTRYRAAGDDLDWTVLVRMDQADVLSPINDVLLKLVTAGAVVVVPLIGLLLWSTARLRREWTQAQEESARARVAEETLRASEAQTRAIVDNALDAVIVMDAEGLIIAWNPQACTMFGWSKDEAMGMSLAEAIIPGEYREAHARGLRRFLDVGEGPILNRRIEVVACYKDGREFPVELSVSPVRQGRTYVFNGFVRDISARKQTERRQRAKLAASLVLSEPKPLHDIGRELLRTVCESGGWNVGVLWQVDRPAGVLRCPKTWYGRSTRDREFAILSERLTMAPGIGLPGRVWLSGEAVWIPDVLQDRNFPRASIAAQAGLHAAVGFPILQGKQVVGVLEFFSEAVQEPDQELLHMMAEIGVQLGASIERQQLGEQLRQAQKMEAVGRLAGGIAHDFNNLLMIINGYSELLQQRLRSDEASSKLAEEVRKAGGRAAALTSQLLAFSRRQVVVSKVLDLRQVVADMESMVRRLIGEDIELCIHAPAEVGRITADPGQIEQVIMNLAVNARDAMPQGGRLMIEIADAPADASRHVVLTVSDTGVGMDDETKAHLFEPFFTTKDRGKGTGLGLAIVYGIVQQCGGTIDVDSVVGYGTTFRLRFPQAQEEASVPAAPAAERRAPDGSETILLVEDEAVIRKLLSASLRERGYRVLEGANGQEALALLQQHRGPLDLVVTDVVLPGLNGRELVDKLLLLYPRTRVLYMSGYADDYVLPRGAVGTGQRFLQKPFTAQTLARKVRDILDHPVDAQPTGGPSR